ncbi:hypothetical protein DFH28DRAFT_888367 [Melampsora americana]|nr:hypothetical protein DFH28DRAFT_888367 [Melampsora americana]
MQSFMRMADQTFSAYNRSEQPNQKPDLFKTGFHKLQEIFQDEYTHQRRSRYRWGSAQAKHTRHPGGEGEDTEMNIDTLGE